MLFGGLFIAIALAYWGLALAIILFALWLPNAWWSRLTLAAVVAAVVVYPIFVRPVKKHIDEREIAKAAHTQRLAAAKAHFGERCKTAGETIRRSVQNVDGVVWMKWRFRDVNDDFDQFKLFDPFGSNCEKLGCIGHLLRLDSPQSGRFQEEVIARKGRFRFVESIDPVNGVKYRYVGAMTTALNAEAIDKLKRETGQEVPDSLYRFIVEEAPIDRFSARYGITWDDISTREDREHWVAGGSLKVIDLETNEVIAERIGYMMDSGLGDKSGNRSPWGHAVQHACPEFQQISPSDTRRSRSYKETSNFVTRVLTATRE